MDDTKRLPKASGRFLLRLSPGLHAALRSAARDSGLSLNDYCARKLALPLGALGIENETGLIVSRAAESFGQDLLGVAVFGSWARGEATALSDVDVLIVVDRRVALTRRLYRTWDAETLHVNGRRVEPQIVHLPVPGGRIGSLWAEAAIDGIVLFECDSCVSAELVKIRHAVLEGRLVRKIAHGHPYWAEVA
jgi:hypothetical protein